MLTNCYPQKHLFGFFDNDKMSTQTCDDKAMLDFGPWFWVAIMVFLIWFRLNERFSNARHKIKQA